MLNLGFSEILVLMFVALVVVGPERLPTMLRFLGRQYGKLLSASRELRRAFYMEAERVESEERRNRLKAAREKAAQKQKELMKKLSENPQNDLHHPEHQLPMEGLSQDHIQEDVLENPPQEEDDLLEEKDFVPFDHVEETPPSKTEQEADDSK